MSVPIPNAYDIDPSLSLLIDVDPDTLCHYATVDIVSNARQIGDHISAVVQIWNSLKLSWAGHTADEAHDFFNRWNADITKLFGTEDDPARGVINKITTGVEIASTNYGEAEDYVTSMFTKFTENIDNPPHADPNPNRDLDDPPITENTP